MVGAFVGRGAIVPVEVRGRDGDGRVVAELFGVATRLRAAPGQASGAAQACLRPENLELAAADEPGTLAARVVRALYRGGHDELELAPDAAPGTLLRVDAAAPREEGARVGVRIDDGWVIPG
jgi:iron(III) transport system ATP-binding protein